MAVSNATNFSNPKDMFEGRSAYKEEFPKTNIQFDTGYSNRLFGKVDTLGNAIQINESYLSFFATSYDKDNVSCIKFMAEAFLDCRKQYNILVSKGNINTSSPFFKETLPVYKGWKKQESLFSSNSNNFYRTLLKYITDNSFKIGDFETYTEIALKFLEENTIPLTRVGFFESTLNPMHTTGLVLEIYEGDAGSDEFREQFISDPNYSLVSDLFADRGLRFDTQVPWRLIANLQSNNLKKYLLKDFDTLDFNIQDIFDKFYFKSFEGVEYNAFQEFKNTLRSFYTAYKNIFPKYDQFVYRESPVQQTFSKGAYISNDCSGIKNIFVYAQDIKLVPDSKEEDLYFLDLYYKARVIETKSNYSDSLKQFHRDNYRGLYLYNSKRQTGIIKVIQYINYNIGTLAFRSPSVDEINLTRAGNDATM